MIGSSADIGCRCNRERDEGSLGHCFVDTQERQVQFNDPILAVFPACVRVENFAVRATSVKAQHTLVWVASLSFSPASVHHVRDDLVRKTGVSGSFDRVERCFDGLVLRRVVVSR
ncbi:hypothetical protein [Paraburkholderia sp. DGU8]|uniref:hypothetical protein n=1 Tax=Paraburkholderia sp. DGU8 TaxID=3161997 RepID=UPI00346759C4